MTAWDTGQHQWATSAGPMCYAPDQGWGRGSQSPFPTEHCPNAQWVEDPQGTAVSKLGITVPISEGLTQHTCGLCHRKGGLGQGQFLPDATLKYHPDADTMPNSLCAFQAPTRQTEGDQQKNPGLLFQCGPVVTLLESSSD